MITPGYREDNEDDSGCPGEMQQQAREFSVEETITGQIISIGNSDKCKVNKNHLLQNVLSLQLRVNNLNLAKKKTSYARF